MLIDQGANPLIRCASTYRKRFIMGPFWLIYVWYAAVCAALSVEEQTAVRDEQNPRSYAGFQTTPNGVLPGPGSLANGAMVVVNEEACFMQRQGAQPGLVDEDTIHMLEDVIRGKVLAIRRRHRGSSTCSISAYGHAAKGRTQSVGVTAPS